MGGQVVEMDYEVIQAVSKGFSAQADLLRGIAKILNTAITILKANFLMRMFYEAMIRWLEGIEKALNNLADVCDSFAERLTGAMGDHKRGDFEGKQYFGQGIEF